MALKNCRNCMWASWSLTKNGRIRPNGYAECVYPVSRDVIVPASRPDLIVVMGRRASVHQHDNVEMDCAAWKKKG